MTTDKPNLTEIDLSEKNNCNVCNKKDKLQKRNNKWYCPKCYLREITKCYICEKIKPDEIIFPYVKGKNISEENMCLDCHWQYENLLTIKENKKNLMTMERQK